MSHCHNTKGQCTGGCGGAPSRAHVAMSSAHSPSPVYNIPMPITGFYADLSQPSIGGRPVYGTHDNISSNDLRVNYINMADRRFDCQQPYWDRKCL